MKTKITIIFIIILIILYLLFLGTGHHYIVSSVCGSGFNGIKEIFIYFVPAALIIFLVILLFKSNGEGVKCIYCKKTIKNNLYNCPYCGNEIKEDVVQL